MSDLFSQLQDLLWVPLIVLFAPGSGQSIFWLAAMALTLAGIALWRRRGVSLKVWRRFILPARVYLHPSALLDYRFFLVGTMVRAALFGGFVMGAAFWAGLIGGMGEGLGIVAPIWLVAVLATVVYVIAFDLGYWFAHWLGHVSPVLWQFHKVHHEAEVLTPFTSLRTHPVDDGLTIFFTSMATGVSFGLMHLVFADGVKEITFLGVNAVFLVYYLTWFNLRHSHHFIIGPKWLGWLVQSPAHHQVHHSIETRHYDTNLAFGLTIWDRLFGTLYTPQKGERITFGVVGSIPSAERTVWDLYWQPFRDAGLVIRDQMKAWARHAAPSSGG